jgi:hypothetical protein
MKAVWQTFWGKPSPQAEEVALLREVR